MRRTSTEEISDGEPERKKRKVRKGTQSCWECKRRKIRCTFAAPSNAICDGCMRRGSSCISQEFPDQPSSARRVEDRLGRVEALLEVLAKKVSDAKELPGLPADASLPRDRDKGNSLRKETLDATSTVKEGIELPHEEASSHHGVSSLLVAWPSRQELNQLSSLSESISGPVVTSLYGLSPSDDARTVQGILQPPPAGSHPVVIARKLLLLCLYLQGVRSFQSADFDGLSVSQRDTIMSRLFDTCHSLVTCNDDIIGCIEGIECLALESMYHNNWGNLRRSWLTTRRAMLIAQLMGLHRGISSSNKTLETGIGRQIDANNIWFRLVQMDRYLSLMLGLPLGYVENSFAEPAAMAGCAPIERMQRLQCVASARISQRDQAGVDDIASAHEIDTLLHEAASLMPSKWWVPPGAGNMIADDTVRIMDLLTHHHLLARLHLPYLLRSSVDREYDYSKITLINASREVVSWYVAFRGNSTATAYCRGADFLAFISSTALCIAHIEARRHGGLSPSKSGSTVFNFLAHQRLADRGMMEHALECLEAMTRDSSDSISLRVSGILRKLLNIEAHAADGGDYDVKSNQKRPAGAVEGFDCSDNMDDGGGLLRIHIPYFGTVNIERGGIYKSPTGALEPADTGPVVSYPNPALSGILDGGHQQSRSLKKSPAGYQIGGESENSDWQSVFASSALPDQSLPTVKNDGVSASPDIDYTYDRQLLVPGLAAAVDDWALQGVDMAFFDSLLRDI